MKTLFVILLISIGASSAQTDNIDGPSMFRSHIIRWINFFHGSSDSSRGPSGQKITEEWGVSISQVDTYSEDPYSMMMLAISGKSRSVAGAAALLVTLECEKDNAIFAEVFTLLATHPNYSHRSALLKEEVTTPPHWSRLQETIPLSEFFQVVLERRINGEGAKLAKSGKNQD